jgi:hypothetical protein
LVEALRKQGFHPSVHEIAVALEGYGGDKRKETAEIVIPRRQVGSASNDIGFQRQPDGSFQPIISEYDRERYDDKWVAELKSEVAIARLTRVAKRQYGCAEPEIRDVQTAAGRKRVVTFNLP